jgi:two-component system, OmpR family, sensor histidine kinase TctE
MSAPDGVHQAAGSLRGRLLGLLLAPLATLLLAGLVVDLVASEGPLRRASDEALAGAAVALAAQHGATRFAPTALPAGLASALGLEAGRRRVYSVRDDEGHRVAGEPELAPVTGKANPALGEGFYAGKAMRLASYRFAAPGGPLTVTVAESVASREGPSRYLIGTTLTLAVLQLGAVAFLVWLAVRRGLEPLLRVEGRLAARSARELEPLDERTVPEEVRGLVRALNELFARVRSSANAQQEFLENAAHQLRTPLAGMQAQLELLARDPAAGAVRERVEVLHEAMRRLAHAAHQLLTLARAEASATSHHDYAPVALKGLCEELIERELDHALERGLDLGLEAEPVSVNGVAWLLREALANLIDNAIAYTPKGGVVTLRAGREGRGAYLEVEDDGPGIAPADRARALERFARLSGSPGHGSGLGLAIVSDVARLHGAELALETGRTGRGLRVRVSFASVP